MATAETFLTCRDLRHAWEWSTDSTVTKKAGGRYLFTRTLACLRCGTTRTDSYEIAAGHVTRKSGRYRYPVGYVVKGGMTAEAARVDLFTRILGRFL